MALCLDGSSNHEHCVFDDVQCLLICELCGAVVSRDESVFEVSFADGVPTSSRVHDQGSLPAEGVSASTVVRATPHQSSQAVVRLCRTEYLAWQELALLAQHRLAGSLGLPDSLTQQGEAVLKAIMPKLGGRRGSSKDVLAGTHRVSQLKTICASCRIGWHKVVRPAGAALYLATYLAGYPLFLTSVLERLAVPLPAMLGVVSLAKQQLELSLEQHQQLSARLQEAHISLAANSLSDGYLPLDVS